MKTVLSIAGFDPSSGAGVTADLMVFAAHGLFGTSCITGLTVQSTLGVCGVETVPPALILETLECLESDLPPVGIKLGMLASVATVQIVADYLASLRGRDRNLVVVLDPVLRSSSGSTLVERAGVEMMRERLLSLVDWVTPNLDELAMLTGRSSADRQDLPALARELQGSAHQLNLVVTGGHLDTPDDFMLTAGGNDQWFRGERIESRSTHGTGCAFSSALLSRLVQGDDAAAAVLGAKAYVAEAIRRAEPIGHGTGPMCLLWPIQR
ncbi:MAG: bifunctional hydroxymethylpyrimidine kinase/phosphomethylpyrimidine kinase [Acidobacteriota bacterium]|nr:bifunctional hydroxymethylpyrimidine kinase/phosphomethylpyrimidine kinase [Acidobacteriota bacterium]